MQRRVLTCFQVFLFDCDGTLSPPNYETIYSFAFRKEGEVMDMDTDMIVD